MNSLLERVLSTSVVSDEEGNQYPLTSNIDHEEGALIVDTITSLGLCHGLEVGCAYGISSMFACGALLDRKSKSYTIIDPFQNTDWRGTGLLNLKRCNSDFVEFYEQPSEIALPALLSGGKRIDFGIIDGFHTFDHTLLDFFYVNRMLQVGGVVFIDDVTFPAIRRVVRHILTYPAYQLYGTAHYDTKGPTFKRKVSDRVLRLASSFWPKSYVKQVYSESWLRNDWDLGISCSMVALRKVAEDERAWNWHEPF